MIIKKIVFSIILVAVLMISCKKSEVLTEEKKQEYITKGKDIAQSSFKALSGKLTEQMKAGGPKQAIPFCNVEAMPLTDSLSKEYNVSIKRTSDKFRNPENEPTQRELEVITNYKDQKSKGAFLEPIVEESADKIVHFYAPILASNKCLACHGKLEETLKVQTDSIIKSLYPNDLATGYGDEELRGIWSITFNK